MKKIILYSGIAFAITIIGMILLWNNCFTSSESNRFLITSILSMLGIFTSIIMVIWGFRLGLKFTEEEAKKKRKSITDQLKYVDNSLNTGGSEKKCHIRIANQSDYTISNCKAFITINNLVEDIIQCPISIKTKDYVFISTNNAKQILEEKTSWALKNDDLKNVHTIDLCAGDFHDLMIFHIADDACIEIPSENGYSTDTGNSRCFLKNQDYEITVRIVSNDTLPKEFTFQYDAPNRKIMFIGENVRKK